GSTRQLNMNHLGRILTDVSDPPVKVLFIYNCNPLMTVPHQNHVRRGLERDDLFTVVFEQSMTDTCEYADLVLPATTFLEHYDVAKGYGAYHLQLVQPVIAPVGEARPNHEVFHELSVRLGLVEPNDVEEDLGEAGAFLEVASRVPEHHGASLREDRQADGPGGGNPVQFVDVHPNTADRKVHLFPAVEATAGLYTFQPDPA